MLTIGKDVSLGSRSRIVCVKDSLCNSFQLLVFTTFSNDLPVPCNLSRESIRVS